jgi:hypothetical protein
MKLTELEPRWIGLNNWDGPEFHIGVTFLCPHCLKQRLAVLFNPPIDPENCTAKIGLVFADKIKWERLGGTFETLTLSPSVDASESGHWHGNIVKGEVI